jgi:hypothetical protein
MATKEAKEVGIDIGKIGGDSSRQKATNSTQYTAQAHSPAVSFSMDK